MIIENNPTPNYIEGDSDDLRRLTTAVDLITKKHERSLILDDAFVLKHQDRKLSLDVLYDFQSSLLLLRELQEYFPEGMI